MTRIATIDADQAFGSAQRPTERAYLSRLQAHVLNVLGRGVIDGSETVAALLNLLEDRGEAVQARVFLIKHGAVPNARLHVKPVRLFPAALYCSLQARG